MIRTEIGTRLRRRSLAAPTALLVGALLLAGCSSNGSPQSGATPTAAVTTASSAPSPTGAPAPTQPSTAPPVTTVPSPLPSAPPPAPPAPTVSTTTELTDDYLAAGQCVSVVSEAIFDIRPATYGPVPCESRTAVAQVTSRTRTALAPSRVPAAKRPACKDDTDFVLDLGPNLARANGDTALPYGKEAYACLRNLKAPHPGDPGQGGGPMIGVGDCIVRTTTADGKPSARELRCDWTGPNKPQYKIVKKFLSPLLTARGSTPDKCAPGTAYEYSDGARQVCADWLPGAQGGAGAPGLTG